LDIQVAQAAFLPAGRLSEGFPETRKRRNRGATTRRLKSSKRQRASELQYTMQRRIVVLPECETIYQ
jgi:hypothetical protein